MAFASSFFLLIFLIGKKLKHPVKKINNRQGEEKVDQRLNNHAVNIYDKLIQVCTSGIGRFNKHVLGFN